MLELQTKYMSSQALWDFQMREDIEVVDVTPVTRDGEREMHVRFVQGSDTVELLTAWRHYTMELLAD